MKNESVIHANDISFYYNPSQIILQNLTFTIESGDFVVLKGPNGAGKSTLLKLLLGFLQPVAGSISILGKTGNVLSTKAKASYVSQKVGAFNADFPATVEEVVSSSLINGTRLFPFLRSSEKEWVDDCLEQVGMSAYSKSLIGQLSGGQQQRVFIARALVQTPQILFLDEPTVGVDSSSVEEICQLLHHLNQRHNITILIVTHDPDSIEPFANRIFSFDSNGQFSQQYKQKEGA